MIEFYPTAAGTMLAVTEATKPDLAHALKRIQSCGLTFGPFTQTIDRNWRAVTCVSPAERKD